MNIIEFRIIQLIPKITNNVNKLKILKVKDHLLTCRIIKYFNYKMKLRKIFLESFKKMKIY
jgi:hypothetical protein